jgi:hypothetical protein
MTDTNWTVVELYKTARKARKVLIRKYIKADGSVAIQNRLYDVEANDWTEWKDIPEVREKPVKQAARVTVEAVVSSSGAIDLKLGDRLIQFAGKKVKIVIEEFK